MVMGWRAAPWHYEARYSRCHTTWVYPPLRTLTRTHGPQSEIYADTDSQGAPAHAATHAMGAAGSTP